MAGECYYPRMSFSLCSSPARDALLSVARNDSPADELKCRALLDLIQTAHALQQALRRELAPSTLTESGFCLMARLIQPGSNAVTPAELAKDLSLSPQTVSAIIGRLEISRIISRKCSSDDRRVCPIKVSAAGRRAFASALSHYLEAITGVMSVLDPHDITTVERVCARLRTISAPVSNS